MAVDIEPKRRRGRLAAALRVTGRAGPWLRAALLAPLLLAAGCEPEVGELGVEVLRRIPHDTGAYTQGLVYHEGSLFESTGRYGESELREVDPETGAVVRRMPLAAEYFGEGLARVGDELVQLTWQEEVVLVWKLEGLELDRTVEVGTHGWGLCFDGDALFMTTGGSILFLRDPVTLEVIESRQITQDGERVGRVNELECVGEHIWANVYQSNDILKIEKATGRVVARLDATMLVPEGFEGDPDAVLNGIAFDPAANSFYLTGKLWPTMYEVRFIPR